jgi:glutamate 5-kinase
MSRSATVFFQTRGLTEMSVGNGGLRMAYMQLELSCKFGEGNACSTELICISIDEGALRAIKRRESGGRLLPAGVVRIEGLFASHQAVRLFVRRRKRPRPNSIDLTDSSRPSTPPDYRKSNLDTSNPITPLIQPIMSLSSSIASLDPLSRSSPVVPAQLSEDDWEEVEVGKGLAQYNSVEIDRIKGMKRYVIASVGRENANKGVCSSHIEQMLGYSDSEHVVDSITFF